MRYSKVNLSGGALVQEPRTIVKTPPYDNTDKVSVRDVTDVTKRHKNPNGSQINAAFCTTQKYSDCASIRKMYNEGHEIAAHSVTHRITELSSSEKKKEISDVKKRLTNIKKGNSRPSSKPLADPKNACKVLKAELNRNYKATRAPVRI